MEGGRVHVQWPVVELVVKLPADMTVFSVL